MRLLFITWDGPQTSYLEGLFLPIFKNLAAQGYVFHVLQFTWADADRIARTKAECEAAGIPYRSIPIWRRGGGVGPFISALRGARHIWRAVREWEIDTLMPRSLMPSLAVVAMGRLGKLRLVFDADGFVADERVDFSGLSPNSMVYKILRKVEARTARLADRVMVRTPKAADILLERAGAGVDSDKFHVVGNGRDPAPYLADWPERTDDSFRLCYAGSLGPKYCTDQLVSTALVLREHLPQMVFRVFTGDIHTLNAALDLAGVQDRSWIEAARLPQDQMPAALMGCDLALVFIQKAFSTQGVVPIKLGEYMLAGLPVIGTEKLGAAEPLIAQGLFCPVGEDLEQVWPYVRDKVLSHRSELRSRAQAAGLRHFALESSVRSYMRALE